MTPLARTARLGAGLACSALAFSLVLRAHLGLGPWHVLQQGLAEHLGITLGQSAWLMGAAMLAASASLGERPGPGTVAVVAGGGALIDLVLPHVATPHDSALRVGYLVVGTLVMSLGGALTIAADVGVSPLDGLMKGLYRVVPVPLFAVRLGLEALGLALGWWAGGEVGIGCLVIGVGIGPGIHAFCRLLRAMPRRAVDGRLEVATA
jgi:uncharacterized membrane protein YczE